MGQELKETGAGSLFTVFGEPDISLERTGDGQAVVTPHAVAAHDPTSGQCAPTTPVTLWTR